MRLWPLAALYGVSGVVIYTLALFQTGDPEFLGRPSLAAWGLFAWSVLAPVWVVLAFASFWHRGPGAGPAATALAASYSAVALFGFACLAAHGWIGLRLWAS